MLQVGKRSRPDRMPHHPFGTGPIGLPRSKGARAKVRLEPPTKTVNAARHPLRNPILRQPVLAAMDVETGTATPRSPVSVKLQFRGHTLVQDKPATSGGKDEGLMASELLLAGLLACQHSTFYKIAAKRRTEAAIQRIDGDMHFENGDISVIKVRFTIAAGAEVGDSSIDTLLKLTDKSCTISKAIRVPIEATYTRVAASAPAASASSR